VRQQGMKTVNTILIPILENAIKESLENYESKNDGNSLGDMYLHYDKGDNALFFYDDMDNLLNRVQLPTEQIFNSATFRHVLQQPEQAQLFDRDYILKPFTVSLVDKDMVVIEELFFLDDDTIQLKSDIWTNIEKELDDFLKDLMK
jgi:hypothetical protein